MRGISLYINFPKQRNYVSRSRHVWSGLRDKPMVNHECVLGAKSTFGKGVGSLGPGANSVGVEADLHCSATVGSFLSLAREK